MDGLAGAPGPAGATGATGATGPTGLAGGFRASYDFEEGAGTSSADGSGSGNNLTLNSSGVSWTTLGHSGSALNYDGASGFVSAADAPGLNPAEEITLQAWVYQTGNASAVNTILEKSGQYVLVVNNGQLQMGVSTVGQPTITTQGGGPIPLNAWTHVMGTYDGLFIRTFVNGLLQAQIPFANGRINSTTNALRIGLNASAANGFAGRIDEVRVLGQARNQENFRAIRRVEGYSNDPTDNGPLNGRSLVIPKRAAATGIRVVWSDNFRVAVNNNACRWEVLFNGAACTNPGPLVFDKYEGNTGSNRHDPNTVVGTCFGLGAGNVTVSTRVYPVPGYSGPDCHTGWNSQLFSIEAEEVY